MTPVFKEFIDVFYDLNDFRLKNDYLDRFEKAEQESYEAIESLFKEITDDVENLPMQERIHVYLELLVICYVKRYEWKERFYNEGKESAFFHCYGDADELVYENIEKDDFEYYLTICDHAAEAAMQVFPEVFVEPWKE